MKRFSLSLALLLLLGLPRAHAQPAGSVFDMAGIARPAAQQEPIPAQSIRIRVVLDAFDHPLPGVFVRIEKQEASAWTPGAPKTTGDDGRVLFSELAPGVYRATATWKKEQTTSQLFKVDASLPVGQAMLLAFRSTAPAHPSHPQAPSHKKETPPAEAEQDELLYIAPESFLALELVDSMDPRAPVLLAVQQQWVVKAAQPIPGKASSVVLPLPRGAKNIQLVSAAQDFFSVKTVPNTQLSAITGTGPVTAEGRSVSVYYEIPVQGPVFRFQQWLSMPWQGVRVFMIQQPGLGVEGAPWVAQHVQDPHAGRDLIQAQAGTWLAGTRLTLDITGIPTSSRAPHHWLLALFGGLLLLGLIGHGWMHRRKQRRKDVPSLLDAREALLQEYLAVEKESPSMDREQRLAHLHAQLVDVYRQLDQGPA